MAKMILSTSHVDPLEKTDFWRAVVGPVYNISSIDGDTAAELEGEITTFPLASLTIGEIAFNEQRYQRDKRLINTGGLDSYLIQIVTEGSVCGDFDGVDAKASPGDILIIDLGRSVQSKVTPGRRMTLVIPRSELDRAVHWKNIHGMVLQAGAASTRLITHFMRGVLAVSAELTSQEEGMTRDALILLISAALNNSEVLYKKSANASPFSQGIKRSIIQFIEQNISSTEIGVSQIQSHFNISRTHLYRLFEPENGVSHYIKNKRLDYALYMLSTNGVQSISGKQIARQCGFDSPNSLYRICRERFGMTLKELVKTGQHLTLLNRNETTLTSVYHQVMNAAQMIMNANNPTLKTDN